MTQMRFDQLAKQYLEEFLTPLGKVERQYEVPGEAKYIDVWFVPSETDSPVAADLGILGRMVETAAVLEPFRNAPTRREVKTCLLKLLWIQEDEERKAATAKRPLPETELPRLWILAATTTQPVIQAFKGEMTAGWLSGMYFLGDGLSTAIVAIDQLPEAEETLWMRVLGRDETQERAIREVIALPATHPRRDGILKLLANWKVRVDIGEIADFSGTEALMALSEAYLEWEQRVEARGIEQGIAQGERTLILRQLIRRVGELPESVRLRIEGLSIEQLNELGEALLDFSGLADLEAWLSQHR
jgi:hypothetical protein